MDLGITYTIANANQFWLELDDILAHVGEDAPLDEYDFNQRSYLTLAAHYHDQYLQTEHDMERCISVLLQSRMFAEHPDRLTDKLIDIVLEHASLDKQDSSAVVYLCMLALEHRGSSRPHVFRLLKQMHPCRTLPDTSPETPGIPSETSVMLVMMDIIQKHGTESIGTAEHERQQEQGLTHDVLPARERLGLAATRLLYEVCRVSRLSLKILALFQDSFIERLFFLVESTRDGDEVFNFTLVRLIIALNEQFMVASLHTGASKESGGHSKSPHKTRHRRAESQAQSEPHHQPRQRTRSTSQPLEYRPPLNVETSTLPPVPYASTSHVTVQPSYVSSPIDIQHPDTGKPQDTSSSSTEVNVVLKVITTYLGEHKTFGENLIYMLNRCEATAEDQCVALLILKILYLLFTTPRTHEYFYTNDLCVLVDVFLRGLNDLPDESEGLRHTFLRVLNPLMTNTQLRTIPYKRDEIRKALLSQIADCHRRHVNQTTRRLVERNLKAPWCIEMGELPPLPSQSPSPALSQGSFTLLTASPQANSLSNSNGDLKPPRPSRAVYKAASEDDLRRRGSTTSVDSVAAISHEKARSNTLSSEDKIALSQTYSAAQDMQASTASIPPSSLGQSLTRPSSSGSMSSTFSGKRRPPSPPSRAKKKPLAAALVQSVASVTSAGLSATPIKRKPPRPKRKDEGVATPTPESLAQEVAAL